MEQVNRFIWEFFVRSEELKYKKVIIEIGECLYRKGFCDGRAGNISQRIEDGCLVTCSGTDLGKLKNDDIVYVPFDKLNSTRYYHKPSSEAFMHIALYHRRPDVNAIVHAHPHYSTAFGIARVSLNPPIMPEVYLQLGDIPIVEYAMPSTLELAHKIAGEASNTNGLIMANHGAVTLGPSLEEAYYRMELLESYAKIVFLAKQLGGVNYINDEELKKLDEVRLKLHRTEVLKK